MSSDNIANPPATASGESKSSRKKKAKALAAAVIPSLKQTTPDHETGSSDPASKTNGTDGENSYVKELNKNIRNINKKLSTLQKVDAIVSENPGVSFDQLLASRKINADQKAALDRKPQLQAQLAQLEEQIAQYKKFDQEYQDKIAQEREILQQSHSQELEKLRDTLKAGSALELKKDFREKSLTLSRFLRAAAARRQLEEDDSDLTKGFEGALLLVYGGDANAVAAIEKLIDGSEDHVPSTEGATLSVTYGQIKQASLEEAPFAAEEAWVDDVAQSQPAAPETETLTDPTIANAGLTELNAGVKPLNGGGEPETPKAPAAATIDASAANPAAEEQWDKQESSADDPLAESYEIIPRDPTETEAPVAAAPVSSVQSWADDTADVGTSTPAAPSSNDGFTDVHHNHRGGRGRGGFQGPPRGGYRGRGGPFDGRGRGRGRTPHKGARVGFRGPRGASGGEQQQQQ